MNTQAIQGTSADAAPTMAEFYFSPDYCGRGPRVILLVGSGWRPAMRAHYGIRGPSFFRRPAHPQEPVYYPNRHPWGWVFQPANVLKYESHWLPPAQLEEMRIQLEAHIQEATTHAAPAQAPECEAIAA